MENAAECRMYRICYPLIERKQRTHAEHQVNCHLMSRKSFYPRAAPYRQKGQQHVKR